MDDEDLFAGATREFTTRLAAVGDDQWGDATPNAEWDVRAVVNHVVGELLWMPPLLGGATVEDVGGRLDGDVLGDDPRAAWEAALTAAGEAAAAADPTATVHLSYADVPAGQYVSEVGADVLVHTWDLARAVGADEQLPPTLVAQVAEWFAGVEEAWRAAGAIGDRVPVPDGADDQTRLLAAFGRVAT
ncbi:MAG: TIGR03086 family metal-binding protein [Acidimicrobiales bacterium]